MNELQKYVTMKTKRLFTLLLLLMVFASGCNKSDEPNNEGNNDNSNSDVIVTTFEPNNITINSAVGGGKVVSNDGSFILMKGICWSIQSPPTTDDNYSENGTGAGDYLVEMLNLNIDTTYYIRAYAVTANGTTYGNEIVFTTKDGVPEINTANVTNITINTAQCGGIVIDNGGVFSTHHGVCWSKNPNPTIEDEHTNDGNGLGSFISYIWGLEINTTYYVRAYASNDYHTAYGEEISFTTSDGILEVSTTDMINITSWGAIGGGIVISNGGVVSTTHGICWSRYPNPSMDDNYTIEGTGVGQFTSVLTNLTQNTTYYVRAYASNEHSTVYGNEISFTTLDFINNGNYVDLGLPSGILWATCNVGADFPEDYGNYYAWGEIETKDVYNWSTYKYCMGNSDQLTKYCDNPSLGNNGFTDNLTTLEPCDDVGTMVFGGDWRIPTESEWGELNWNTTHVWTTQNGVKGLLFTASNGNSLFLPAAGKRDQDGIYSVDVRGNYWSSTLTTYLSYDAMMLEFGASLYNPEVGTSRHCGFSVRPVRSANK